VTELEERLKRLGVSTSKMAKLVGLSQPAMRLIVKGVNTPRPEHAETIKKVLDHLRYCETCGRAFLEEDDGDDGDAEAQAKNRKAKRQAV